MATTMDYSDHKEQFAPMPNIDEELKYELPPLNIDINNKGDENRKRRFSVSAESSDNKKLQFIKKKSPESKAPQFDRIKQSTQDVFLFQGLEPEQLNLLIDAMIEKKCEKGEEIISQQDKGDYFYVIEKGIYEVYKSENKNNPSNDAKLVFTYNNKGAFGELALMYNAPRAATVKALTDGVLWAVDRQTFRHIIVGCTARKRKQYDKFLKDVPLLMNVSDETRSAIADVLEQIYPKPQKESNEEKEKEKVKEIYIIEQGDDAEHFYFIQEGQCKVTLNGKNKMVRHLKKGDYFGEKACISGCPRSANVIVEDDKTMICGMDKAAFIRLLRDPLYDKFRQRIQNVYEDDDNDPNKQDDGDLSDIGTTYN